MNKSDKVKIESYGNYLCKEWKNSITKHVWENNDRKQALRDALYAMKKLGLIKDFNINGVTL